MNTITLQDFIRFNDYDSNTTAFANYKGTEEWFNVEYLVNLCNEQDISLYDVIVTIE